MRVSPLGGLFKRLNIRPHLLYASIILIVVSGQAQKKETPVEIIFWGY
jgi:hypothetical protein